jgi:hypothetical protein
VQVSATNPTKSWFHELGISSISSSSINSSSGAAIKHHWCETQLPIIDPAWQLLRL